ncbi:MAG: cytochrome c3 family protein, partial [Deltaproteobacteria bacterium]|nr:cytochrome c3 family protein [Deltaproteobacteria bacterium]
MLRTLKLSHILAMIPVFIVALAVLSSDAQSNFRESFIENYNTNNFNKQKFLVMKRKAEVPAEIDLFIKDAMATENVAGRMYYLDMANTLATMHMHWNDGPKELLTKIEKLQKVELDKRNAQKELQKIRDAAEDTPGNFIMETNKAAIDKAGVAPVIYPHWVHRSFFRCKTCHTGLFEMKLGANEINHKNMAEGTLCGACHDGSYSFASNKNDSECIRCHNFGKEESTPIIDLSYYDAKKFEEIAERVGSVWNTKNLPDGELPLDRLKFINWVTLDKLSAFTPLDSFNGTEGTDEGVRISHILFETNS